MKLPKVIRPEIEVEYKGLKGFLLGVYGVLKFGVRRMELNFTVGKAVVAKHNCFVMPRYKFIRR